eukprot:11718758-Alexandrium_andersonii.AAC.1
MGSWEPDQACALATHRQAVVAEAAEKGTHLRMRDFIGFLVCTHRWPSRARQRVSGTCDEHCR